MTLSNREVSAVSLSVSRDPGHGGMLSHYRIERPQGAYEVSVTISRFSHAPGENSFRPSTLTQVLQKDGVEITDFLARLAREYKVFELKGSACPHVLLHPTFYKFRFTDSEGVSHEFEYSVEAGLHHDDICRRLAEEFEQFFEARRVARSFYEREMRPPESSARLRRMFRHWTSRIFNR